MKNILYPFTHHALMLSDKVRLERYNEALKNMINDSSIIVDIGSGTGILSYLAVECGAKKVIGIEYIEATYNISEMIRQYNNIHSIQFICGRSYDIQLDISPSLLVTETIGPIGPEEKIVELCYDFCQRHPTIDKIIPSQLSIYAQPIYSVSVEESYNLLLNNYIYDMPTSFSLSNNIKELLDIAYCSELKQKYIKDYKLIGPEILLVTYKLGYDTNSTFQYKFDKRDFYSANAIYFYFRIDLAKGITLDNKYSSPQLHWIPYYFKICQSRDVALLNYDSNTRNFSVTWK
jgi:predicted RNA methylase